MNKTQSCASCHNPKNSYTDKTAKSLGFDNKILKRNTPTIYNVALYDVFFWDGRTSSIYEATLSPILERNEMNMTINELENRVNSSTVYKKLFQKVYKKDKITIKEIINCLIYFQKSLIRNNSNFDRFIEGDTDAISKSAYAGYLLFKGKAKCINCHDGKNFTDNSFHNIGVKTSDFGRANINLDKDYNMSFRVPTLKNISMTAPYMHNGSINTLEQVIDFYDRGGDVKYKNLSSEITTLKLNNLEKKQIIEFLKTLNNEFLLPK